MTKFFMQDYTIDRRNGRTQVSTPARVIFGSYPVQFHVDYKGNGHGIYRVNAYFLDGTEQEIGAYREFNEFIDDVPDAVRRITATSGTRPSGILVSGNLKFNEREELSDRFADTGVRDLSFSSANSRLIGLSFKN